MVRKNKDRHNVNSSKNIWWLFLVAFIFIVLSQLFYILINYSFLYSLSFSSAEQVEEVLAKNVADHISLGLRLKINLVQQRSVPELINKYVQASQAQYYVLADVSGQVLYGNYAKGESFYSPEISQGEKSFQFRKNGLKWRGLPIVDRNGVPEAYFYFALDSQKFWNRSIKAAKGTGNSFVMASLTSLVILFFFMFIFGNRIRKGTLSLGKIRIIFLIPFLISIFIMTLDGYKQKLAFFKSNTWESVEQLAGGIRADFDNLRVKGLEPISINGLDKYLTSRIKTVEIISAMALVDRNYHFIVGSDTEGSLDQIGFARLERQVSSWHKLYFPIDDSHFGKKFIKVILSEKILTKVLVRMIFQNLTLIIIALVMLMELLRFLFLVLYHQAEKVQEKLTKTPEVMRFVGFMTIFATDLSLSFIPLKMENFKLGLWDLSHGVFLGLPISAEMLLMGLATIIAGPLAGKVGWKPLLVGGLFLTGGGYFFSGLAQGPESYVLARAMTGFGYGLMNMAFCIFVLSHSRFKSAGMAELGAGFFAGYLCGCAVGGLLAEYLGFDLVFMISAAMCFILVILVMLVFRASPSKETEREISGPILGLLKDRGAWILTLCQIIPVSMVTVGLLNYLLPLNFKALGLGPGEVGQFNLFYCLILIYMGPVLASFQDHTEKKHLFLAAAVFMSALALYCFYQSSMAGMIFGICFLSLAQAICQNGGLVMFMSMPGAVNFGTNRTISAYSTLSRMGQMAGPLAMGLILVQGPGIVVALVLIVALAFFLGLVLPRLEKSQELRIRP